MDNTEAIATLQSAVLTADMPEIRCNRSLLLCASVSSSASASLHCYVCWASVGHSQILKLLGIDSRDVHGSGVGKPGGLASLSATAVILHNQAVLTFYCEYTHSPCQRQAKR